MADETVYKAGADFSDLMSELNKAFQGLTAYTDQMDKVAAATVKTSRVGDEFVHSVKAMTSSGQTLIAKIIEQDGALKTYAASLQEVVVKQKEFAEAQAKAKYASGAEGAATILSGSVLSGALPPDALAKAARIQQQLTKALAPDPQGLIGPAIDMMSKLRVGIVSPESTRDMQNLQRVLIGMLDAERSITAEKTKQSKLAAEAASITTASRGRSRTPYGPDVPPGFYEGRAADLSKFFSEKFGTLPTGLDANVTSALVTKIQAAQAKLSAAIASGFKGGMQDLEKMVAEANAGVIRYGNTIDTKVYAAVRNIVAAWDAVRQKQEQAGNTAPQYGNLRTQIANLFQIPQKASTESIARFNASLNTLLATASRAKVPLQDVQRIFDEVSRNPRATFSGEDPTGGLMQTHAAAQRVMIAYDGIKRSAKAAEDSGTKAGRALFVSLNEFLRILQIQLVHRFFGALITNMQQAVGAAADLQVKISEIRTISQGSGIDFRGFQDIIRQNSEAFNQPQVQVAEAMYQAFSNQVIKTGADMSFFTEAMRFSRIAVTDATTAVNLMSSVTNAYSMSTGNAREVTDQLFKAIELGRFRANDIANSIGRVTVVASEMGVKLPEVLGLLTTITRSGVGPAEAMTQVSALMQSLMKPSEGMTALLRSWGVSSGQAAISTFGFVEVLRRLTVEAQSSGSRIAELLPNVRAIRGALSQSGPGGIGALQTDIEQIRNSAEQASNAASIVAESAGDRFKQQLVKISNFFLNDFGNNFLLTIERLTAPFGGLAALIQKVGGAVVDLVNNGASIATIFTSLVGWLDKSGVSLDMLIKGFVAYRVAAASVTLVTAAYIAVQAAWNQAKFAAGAAQIKDTAETLANTAAKIANTAAVRANSAANAAAAAAAGVAGGAQNVFTFGLLQSTTAANSASVATTIWTMTVRALTIALYAIPFVALVAGVALLMGAFDPLIDRFSGINQSIEELQRQSQMMTTQFNRDREERQRTNQKEQNEFQQDVAATGQAWGRVLAMMRRESDAMVEEQRAVVERTTENLKIVARGITDTIAERVSEARKKVEEAANAIKQSLKKALEEADKDASTMFQHALKAAGMHAEVVGGGGHVDLTNMQQMQEIGQRVASQQTAAAFQQQAYARQRQVITGRINDLQREADELVRKGDVDSMASARRKYEEIRRLTEQDFDIQTQSARSAAHTAAEAASAYGGSVVATYKVNLDELEARIRRITQMEQAAEAQFRQHQQQAQAAAAAELERRRAQQKAIQDQLKLVMEMQAVDAQGNIPRRFQNPNDPTDVEGARRRFLQQFTREWQRLQDLMQAGGAPMEQQMQMYTAMLQQRAAMEQQLMRQVVNNNIRAREGELTALLRQIEQLDVRARAARESATAGIETGAQDINRQLQAMTENIRVGMPRGIAWSAAQSARNERLAGLRDQFLQQQQEVTAAASALNAAKGTDSEAEAMSRLQRAVDAVSRTYREFVRVRYGAKEVPGLGISGNEAARQSLFIEQATARMREQLAALAQSKKELEEAKARLDALTGAIGNLPQRYREAAAGLGEFGRGIQDNQARIQAFETSINGLVLSFQHLAEQAAAARDRMREAAGVRPPQAPVVPPAGGGAAPAPGGGNAIGFGDVEAFASGGLIGGRFTKRGPDDRLIFARGGEMVINSESTARFYSQLVAINAGRMPQHFAGGGLVTTTNVGDITVNVNGEKTPEATARVVVDKMRREFRRGNRRL